MITRIVRMQFTDETRPQFELLFAQTKAKIRNFPGILHLSLLKDLHDVNVYYTYSIWDCEASLEQYRNSELFKSTWAATKVLFAQPAIAFSAQKVESV